MPTLVRPPLARIPVQAINKMVMETEDVDMLIKWLEEEKNGAKRRSALHRIYHRLNTLRSSRDHEELDRLADEIGRPRGRFKKKKR